LISEFWNPKRAESFKDEDTVHAYRLRAPYPEETFEILSALIVDSPRTVLDAGCGRGEIARRFVDSVDRIDAVDFSRAMINAGMKLSGGDNTKIRWIEGKIEDAALEPPYALITAGMSIHWMNWDKVAPRFLEAMTENANLAIINTQFSPNPWDEELKELRNRYSDVYSRQIKPPKVIEELEKQGRFEKRGSKETDTYTLSQSLGDYIEQFHSRSDMARVLIGAEAAEKFDNELGELMSRYIHEGIVEVGVRARVVWGRPLLPAI
jgi:trans-aconitate methyltransferase